VGRKNVHPKQPRDRQTDGQTDTAHIGNNSLHPMHSMPPRKANFPEIIYRQLAYTPHTDTVEHYGPKYPDSR